MQCTLFSVFITVILVEIWFYICGVNLCKSSDGRTRNFSHDYLFVAESAWKSGGDNGTIK